MFTKVLVANRGEIACRIIRTLDRLGVKSVAVYSDADARAAHVSMATEAVRIGPAQAADSYLRGDLILEAALKTGAQGIHPGYGFLSENPDFAAACEDAGVAFIGPAPRHMRSFGLKHTAREIAGRSGVPLLPGTGLLESPDAARAAAARVGFPVMLKSTAGGGGIGMRLCRGPGELDDAFAAVRRLGANNFKHSGLFLEKYVEHARHVEVQIFGDGLGDVVALGERDCSAQRRNQKVVEETPAPGVGDALRGRLFDAAVTLGRAVGYRSAGTVEFIVDAAGDRFYFLEVNTRLQVEHGVTELVTGLDLVEWMVRCAAGELPPLRDHAGVPRGAAIEVRVYAEDPSKNFQPSAGVLTEASFPSSVRVDTWVARGTEVSSFYDPLVAKILAHADTRDAAVAKLRSALADTRLSGIETNLEYLRHVIDAPVFRAGGTTTQFLGTVTFEPATIDVLKPGTLSTVQDYPGRMGYWDVGVPPSGPMDHLSFRLGNRVVGNAEGAAGLELTVTGPTLKFNRPAVICLAGAVMSAALDGRPVPQWRAVDVPAGATLTMGAIGGAGLRTYLLVRGGIDVPEYLGSKSTFTLGNFGGHGGRGLRAGDVLRACDAAADARDAPLYDGLPPQDVPTIAGDWQIGVLDGPHGAPDFFTPQDIETFYATEWQVHYNSSRTGVRLVGPKPQWARPDGGEAGLHPSNIHDTAYAVGAVDFTGDMPIILGPDGPSCGGFVCPVTIAQCELWQAGQLKPGDRVRFVPTTDEAAATAEIMQNARVRRRGSGRPPDEAKRRPSAGEAPGRRPDSAVLRTIKATRDRPLVTYRRNGDRNLLVEYGPMALDLNLRFRVHSLMQWFREHPQPGLIDLCPGIRSLQVHFDSGERPVWEWLDVLATAEDELPRTADIEVPTRIVHLPLSWDDPACQLAVQKYMQSVRADAPWCPSNIEFIRRINGLGSVDEVKQIVFDASYFVLALGDVYLGAPVATPIDPRHRLVTTKYNPARTWTAENSVGIGGAYLCVYGMEGPGGYQFVGRTCQMWNTYGQTADFTDGKPWLLRFFDQVRFHETSPTELLKFREAFAAGRVTLDVTAETFSLRKFNAFLAENRESIAKFKGTQQAAFEAERRRWEAAGTSAEIADAGEAPPDAPAGVPPHWESVFAEVPGSLWKLEARKGQYVAAGERLAIIESMKMEIPVLSPASGVVADVFCAEGRPVAAGQVLFCVDPT